MENRAINICAIITASVLSVILTVLLIVIPVYYSVTILVKPHGIVKVIQRVDYKQIISSNESVAKTVKKFGITPEEVDNAIKSPEVGSVLEKCSPAVIDFVENIPETGFNADSLTKLTKENFDSVITAVEESSKINLPNEKIEKIVTNTIKKNEKSIKSVAPQVEEVITTVKTVTEAPMLEKTKSSFVGIILIIFAVASAFLILALRFFKLKGILWLGIIACVSAVALAFIIIMGERLVIDLLTRSLSDLYSQFLGTAVSFCNQRLGAGFSAVAFSAVACFTVYGVFRNKIKD